MLSRKFVAAGEQTSTLQNPVPAPFMRKNFAVNGSVRTARLLFTALGFYRVFINGNEITRGHLSPYISNLDHYIYYDVYDLEKYLVPGKNTLAMLVGAGFRDPIGGNSWDFDKVPWRGAPAVGFELCYTDDSGEHRLEADESVLTHPSPIYMNDLRLGEFYDARNNIPGWNESSLDDSGWSPAVITEPPKGEFRQGLHAPILVDKEYPPVDIRRSFIARLRLAPDEQMTPYPEDEHAMEGWLYDFGTNNAGTVRLKIRGTRGQKIVLQFGELLDPLTGGLDLRNMHYAPIGFDHRCVYILNGDPEGEEFIPSFTYFGFRYVLVMGLRDEQAVPETLTCRMMHTQLTPLAGVTSSCALLNDLWAAAQRSNLANLFHFPTDCPHREKNGWTGDASLSAEQMLMSYSVENNLREWLNNIRKAQQPDGLIPDIIPTGTWGYRKKLNPLWDKVIVDLPWFIWRYRGDPQVLNENADAIYRFIVRISELIADTPDHLMPYGFGDWCPYDKVFFDYSCPEIVTGSLGCIEACRRAAGIFDALNRTEQAAFCRQVEKEISDSFRRTQIDRDTCVVAGDSQTGQAMAIALGMFSPQEEKRAFAHLLNLLHAKDDLLTVGVIGSRYIFDVLSEHGQVDLAMNLLVTERQPSLGSYIVRGDTSLPESVWKQEPGDPGSHNHHFFGDCCTGWFLRALAGIQLNPDLRDIHRLNIAPHFPGMLNSFEAWHISPDGKISVQWVRSGNTIRLDIRVPETMHGEIRLPDGWRDADGNTTFALASGSHDVFS